MQKQQSVARILGAVVGTLGIVLVVMSAYSLRQAVSRYFDSGRIVSLAVASRDMTNAVVIFRLERGDTLSFLSSPAAASDAALNSIAQNRQIAEQNYEIALKTASAADAPGLNDKIEKLRAAWSQVAALRPQVSTALRQDKASREPKLADNWLKASDAYMDAIGDMTMLLDGSMSLIDPLVDQSLHSFRFVTRNLASEGAFAHPKYPRRFLLRQPLLLPSCIRFFESHSPGLL